MFPNFVFSIITNIRVIEMSALNVINMIAFKCQ